MVFLHCLHVCRQYVSVTTKYEKMIFCIYCNMVPVNSPSQTPLKYYLAKQNNPLFVAKHGLLHLGADCKLLVLAFLVLVVGQRMPFHSRLRLHPAQWKRYQLHAWLQPRRKENSVAFWYIRPHKLGYHEGFREVLGRSYSYMKLRCENEIGWPKNEWDSC